MQAATSSLIGTNRVPSEVEIVEIRGVLHDRRYRLASLAETSTLGAGSQMFSSLQKTRDALQGEVAALLALLSSSRRLSPELVAEIFELCLPPGGLSTSVFRPNEAPILVAQICRGWRQVALSTPRLWTRMSICLPLGHLPQSVWIAAIARASFASLLWLSRSGRYKLHLYVQYVRSDESDRSQVWLPAATELVSRLLLRHGSQIESLTVFLPVPCVSAFLRISCTSLRRFMIIDHGLWRHGDYHLHRTHIIPMGVYMAGQLRHLVLDTPTFDLQRTQYPWDQLTSLHLRQQFPVSLSDSFNLLCLCRRLYTFKLNVVNSTGMVVNERFVAHSLRELWLYARPDDSEAFLGAILIPNMKKLVIGDGHHQNALLDFLGTLSRPLLSLRFHRIHDMPEEDLTDVLKLVPSLTELSTDSVCHNLILMRMTPENGYEPLCPHLRSLIMRLHLANEQLIELLEARCGTAFRDRGIAQLKTAHLTFMDFDLRDEAWEWDDVAWMKKVDQWRRQGVDLQLSDFNWNEGWDGAFVAAFGE